METKEVTTITWKIKNFSSLPSSSIYSDQFVVGGCKWRLLAYPKGYKKDNNLSLYLEIPDKESLPAGCRRHAKFSLTVVNHFSEILSQLKEIQHWFDQNSTTWGYPKMITLTEIANKGFLVNGELKIVTKVEVLEVVGKLDVSQGSSPVMETIDVNGFQVLPSQEESVKSLFERHLDFASKVRPKNPNLKTAYMNVLLSLTQTLSKSPQELSNDDIFDAGAALAYLREAGFKLDWLEEKKKKEEACLTRLREMDEELQSFKKKCLDLEDQINKEKEELLAVRASLSLYNDNVV